MQLRISPGGKMRFSRRSRPELPPSSVTVTIAVRLEMGCCSLASSSRRRTTKSFSPRSSVDNPVPPPSATTQSPRGDGFDLEALFFTSDPVCSILPKTFRRRAHKQPLAFKSSNRRWEGKLQVIAMAIQLTCYGYDASFPRVTRAKCLFDSSTAAQPPEPSFSG